MSRPKGSTLTKEHIQKIRLKNIGQKRTEETKRKMSKAKTLSKHPKWIGGRFIHQDYFMVRVFDHPYADPRGYVYEQRFVMEKKLGRYLNPEEIVHHLDLNKQNNDPSNLHLFDNNAQHMTYHQFLRGIVRSIVQEVDKNS